MTVAEAHASEEVELKFTFATPEAGERIMRWLDRRYPPSGPETSWRTLEITDRYFDTPDSALEAAGYGARLRTVEGKTVLTMKSDIETYGGLHRRLELEAPATRNLEPQGWPDSEARARLIEVCDGKRLIERFAVGQQRRERELTLAGATAVASLDEAEVEFMGAPAGEIRQFEVELRDGDAEALRVFARAVTRARLARSESHSKLDMAAALATDAARVAVSDRWSDAARKMLRRHLVRLLEREPATRAGDAQALKQMRVATRRMRATWRVFDEAFSGAHAEHFDAGLRRLAGLLGTVRDLDVLLESVAGRNELAALSSTWRVRRDAAFADLVRYLDGQAYARFVDDLLDGTSVRGEWSPGRQASQLVADLSPMQIDKGRERMLAAAQLAQGSNEAAAWHALRIAAKRMRYSLEALRDVLDERAATEFIESLRTLQDVLGEMNDASVAAREAAQWLTGTSGADAPVEDRVAVARFVAEREAAVGKARLAFAREWPKVESAANPTGATGGPSGTNGLLTAR